MIKPDATLQPPFASAVAKLVARDARPDRMVAIAGSLLTIAGGLLFVVAAVWGGRFDIGRLAWGVGFAGYGVSRIVIALREIPARIVTR